MITTYNLIANFYVFMKIYNNIKREIKYIYISNRTTTNRVDVRKRKENLNQKLSKNQLISGIK